MTYQIIKQDMFTAPLDTWLLGSVNCRGVWGGGIAFFMKEKYPKSFELYNKHCKSFSDDDLIGSAQLVDTTELKNIPGKPRKIINLFTSKAFGMYKDFPDEIVENTRSALDYLWPLLQMAEPNSKEINIWSNKFNSGLFDVPWEDTEKVLLEALEIAEKKYKLNINWTVCNWN